jgi:hypothetical protein
MLRRSAPIAPFPTLGIVEDHLESLKEHLTGAYQRLEDSKRLGVPVATTRRFFEIEGLDLAGLLALELFTTIIPLVLIGYGWAVQFSNTLSIGDFLIRWMQLDGASASIVNDLFGTGASLRSLWTLTGLGGFLFWGIPMSAQVAKTWARAFRRERFPFWTEVGRGAVWFVVLMVTQAIGLALARRPDSVIDFLVNLAGFVPGFVLWAVSPAILIRNGRLGWRQFVWCGLVGVILDNVFARFTLRWIFPQLLDGWVGFGPIGAAMALMTTCTIIATLWVVSACMGAVIWERKAPADTVVVSQQPVQQPLPF